MTVARKNVFLRGRREGRGGSIYTVNSVRINGPKQWFVAWATPCHRGLGLFYHSTKQQVLHFHLICVLFLKTGCRIRKNMHRTTELLMLQNRGAFYVSQHYPLSCWTPSKCLTGAYQPLQVPFRSLDVLFVFSLVRACPQLTGQRHSGRKGLTTKCSMVRVTHENWAVIVRHIQGDTTDFLHKSETYKYIHTKYIQHRKKKKK